ncbi:cobalamin B12-binding domain-containing protein [Clostridium beijerinckii]|jgi:Predicted cobalamin binding protein|uniref:Cobalamin-dependent protein n=2 Tax=Clostridium beijerinckii TaxID=1520 RepID=A0AAE2UZ98_CLOBE|nr:cobalamin-dependent protein [Clostridium beijerinckii]ABR32892.1 cobalamin B12-binding domain protein [Clostridium beijerinckii NCIMB 8052]AIU02069.1 cobalamin B12-binding domain-containing protein [Clostridium beijerinckii ATCC 35702]MBF7807428.1 cobalamin-dependent protein [Clostridium beijerinckii]NRT25863.1 methanogenic corrinoid protein MtbC1 [Clostridium beijerinckii]NRT66541.1 methanogenic corrinoid protein MtbC1 [Clostridium beijerinckii]
MMNWEAFEKALISYDKLEVNKILQHFLAEKNGIDFIDEYIVKSLTSIGEKWERGEVALSQIYMSSRLCEEIASSILEEKNFTIKNAKPIAIVTLEEYHTLGKKIVSAVVRSSGFDLIDYGSISGPEEIIKRVTDDSIKILMISVLMYPSALKIKKISQMLHEKDPSIKILVGGAPFLMDSTLWEEVGADKMGKSAADNIAIIEQWMKEDS